MPGDIFTRCITYGGSFMPEGTSITFAGGGSTSSIGAIVRNVNINYNQAVSRIWDLGSGKVFFVAGQTNGTWGIGTVAGVSGGFAIYGCVCAPGTITFNGNVGMCNVISSVVSAASFILHDTILSQVGVTAQSEDMIINQGIGGTFLYLEEGATPTGGGSASTTCEAPTSCP
jgi:hypothetical protein